jgi:hypothetical protein
MAYSLEHSKEIDNKNNVSLTEKNNGKRENRKSEEKSIQPSVTHFMFFSVRNIHA